MSDSAFKVKEYKVSSTSRVEGYGNAGFVSRLEANSHTDMMVAGKNCIAMNFTERSCRVQLYSDKYNPTPDVPIVMAATGFTSKTGLNYILVFPEALYMPELDHSLFNSNQLRHHGTIVQDNPYGHEPMAITSPDGTFTACLESEGTDIFLNTWAPSDVDLRTHPHVVLSSNAIWNPREVRMPSTTKLDQQEIEPRNVFGVQSRDEQWRDGRDEHGAPGDLVYLMDEFRTSVIASATVTHDGLQLRTVKAIAFEKLPPPPVMPGPLEEREYAHRIPSYQRTGTPTPHRKT